MIFTERAHNEHMSVGVHGSYTELTRLVFFILKHELIQEYVEFIFRNKTSLIIKQGRVSAGIAIIQNVL